MKDFLTALAILVAPVLALFLLNFLFGLVYSLVMPRSEWPGEKITDVLNSRLVMPPSEWPGNAAPNRGTAPQETFRKG